MGLFDDALQGAVPGGNVATPLAIAAGALLLGKYLSNRSAAPAQPAAPTSSPAPQQGGGLLSGLTDLVQKFQNAGYGEAVNSWVGSGPNQPVSPSQVGSALGQQTISDLARQAGVSEQELLSQLSLVLPSLVDKLTPNGRLPTQAELAPHGY
ncbi:MAG TPA: YidB family protein [Roseiarcus sp.]|nr:YidB family protein [Roseiarcus sp.]